MRVHRTEHARHFTVLPNAVLQDRRLSYTARGLLADLLSRPDGWQEDGRHMADTSPQGRGAIRKALKELADAGFYRVETVRMPDGTVRNVSHVYDTPWPTPPGVTRPAPGAPAAGCTGIPVVKNQDQETSLPANSADADGDGDEAEAGKREGAPEGVGRVPAVSDEQSRRAVATLLQVIRAEPRLRLGQSEAEKLAPLVVQWLERGGTSGDLAQALLPGLPTPVHSPAAVLRYRLEHKMPPIRSQVHAPEAWYAECVECRDPAPRPGLCRACAGLGKRSAAVGCGFDAAAKGANRARTALRAARVAFSNPCHSAVVAR